MTGRYLNPNPCWVNRIHIGRRSWRGSWKVWEPTSQDPQVPTEFHQLILLRAMVENEAMLMSFQRKHGYYALKFLHSNFLWLIPDIQGTHQPFCGGPSATRLSDPDEYSRWVETGEKWIEHRKRDRQSSDGWRLYKMQTPFTKESSPSSCIEMVSSFYVLFRCFALFLFCDRVDIIFLWVSQVCSRCITRRGPARLRLEGWHLQYFWCSQWEYFWCSILGGPDMSTISGFDVACVFFQ